jgi:hypothetical protein
LDVGASFKCKKEFWCYVERQIFGLCWDVHCRNVKDRMCQRGDIWQPWFS